ncbi:hypothetical protein NDN01_03660 [Sphingomonas sp. QA11]|uniref:hypothetical protein n=1 Tax=Sphingomonas sp. QA11 TaxID=2950605 RepID=UPI00234A53D3|nr:hypothetical protein [Sphingomonas sp. QA11]WCM28036.1 hypothetical protein NDN01_03660 [Sphingomonas sp. QA11]
MLAVLLSAAFAFQLLAVDDLDLPAAGPIGGSRAISAAGPGVVSARGGAAILARSMFAPSRAPVGNPGAGAIGGVTVVGSVRIGSTVFVVVQGPGNRIANVRLGGKVGEWRLRAIRATDALLVRGEEKITVPFGAREPLSTTAAVTGNQ